MRLPSIRSASATARPNCKNVLDLEYSVCQQGSAQYNEDRIGRTEHCAWVIDGATDLFRLDLTGPNTDVSFTADALSRVLAADAEHFQSLAELLKQAVAAVRRRFPEEGRCLDRYPEYMQPHFAMALCREEAGSLHCLVLGDCCLALEHAGSRIWLTDRRLDLFNRRNRQGLRQLRYRDQDSRSQELAVYQKTRTNANTPDGYWIGSLSGIGLPHAVQKTLPLADGDRILLCSDGFTEYFNLPGALDKEQIPFERHSIQAAFDHINRMFEQDEDRSRILREKKKDGKSALLFQVKTAASAAGETEAEI